MCDSIADGGTRCAAHTRPPYASVKTALLAATAEHRATIRGGFLDDEPHAAVVAAHASTRSGRREVETLLDQVNDTDPATGEWLQHCLRSGDAKAEAARAIKTQIAQRSLRSAMRRLGAARNPHIAFCADSSRRFLMAAAEKEATHRFAAFKALAEADRSLRAPDGWIERFRSSGTHTAAVPTDRVTAYALWRTQTTGADFAPAHYDPDRCTRLIAGADRWRPGDVIDEPGSRSPGGVALEGKTVERVHRNEAGKATDIQFADGTHVPATQTGVTYTIYRPISVEEEAALLHYNAVNEAAVDRGHIPGRGWYAVDPDTGDHVFDPWGM